MASAKAPNPNRRAQGPQDEVRITRQRMTRYSTTAVIRRPDHIDRVLRGLVKVYEAGDWFKDKKELRQWLGTVSREYRERGPADELVRYLYNNGFLLESDSGQPLFGTRSKKRIEHFLERIAAH